MWEKRLNENYFKLFRKRRERESGEGKRQTKQETGKENKGKEARECHPPRAGSSVASVTISAKAERGGGELDGNFADKGKG